MDDKRKQAIREYRQWLENFGWAWYVRLKIRARALTDAGMKQLFYEWISDVERLHGGTGFRWVYVLEQGRTKGKRHFHVLIGGLRSIQKELASRWIVIGGDSVIDRYDPDKDGIHSMLKTMDDNGRLDIDFKLPVIPGVWAPARIAERPHRKEPEDEGTARLRVANIGDDTSPDDLRRLFSKCGTVSDVLIHSSPRYAFALVDIPRGDVAEAAKYLNEKRWRGRDLRVEPGSREEIDTRFESTADLDLEDEDMNVP
jgi:hypothetical protein